MNDRFDDKDKMKEVPAYQDEADRLIAHRFPRYEELPAFGLYMDQVVTYVNDQVGPFYLSDEKLLTTSMVNNYVKHGVVPKPEKKKYSRSHIAYLIAVCILKKVLSIPESTALVKLQLEDHPTEQAFDSFLEALEESIGEVFAAEGARSPSKERHDGEADGAEEADALIRDAVRAFSYKVCVQKKMAYVFDKQPDR